MAFGLFKRKKDLKKNEELEKPAEATSTNEQLTDQLAEANEALRMELSRLQRKDAKQVTKPDAEQVTKQDLRPNLELETDSEVKPEACEEELVSDVMTKKVISIKLSPKATAQ